jgi:hypothetical protein
MTGPRAATAALAILMVSFAGHARGDDADIGREIMINAGTVSSDLRKFPKDDFDRFRNAVLNGKNQAMPAWRDKLSDDDLKLLWAYVRSGG